MKVSLKMMAIRLGYRYQHFHRAGCLCPQSSHLFVRCHGDGRGKGLYNPSPCRPVFMVSYPKR